MSELTPALRQFLDTHILGVLATQSPSDQARQSAVYFVRDGDRLLISSVAARRKVTDVQQTGWASLCVTGQDRPFPSATFSGRAEILTHGIGAATAAVAQRFMGAAEPPEEETDEALAGVGRIIIAITIERVTAVNHLAG